MLFHHVDVPIQVHLLLSSLQWFQHLCNVLCHTLWPVIVLLLFSVVFYDSNVQAHAPCSAHALTQAHPTRPILLVITVINDWCTPRTSVTSTYWTLLPCAHAHAQQCCEPVPNNWLLTSYLHCQSIVAGFEKRGNFAQIMNLGFKTHNFEAVVATDLKLALNILTSFCYKC